MTQPAVDPRLRVNPLSVACSFCGAKPWHRCRWVTKGIELLVPHRVRWRLAKEQAEGK